MKKLSTLHTPTDFRNMLLRETKIVGKMKNIIIYDLSITI